MSIQNIQEAFISEASAAPSLFADLAKVELYIAESYRSRAFVELLQNADDAGARRFLIRQKGDRVIVANDGRPFTDEDVLALCRSGASNKQRGSKTIGYRGIGFKSVAGIASDIIVVSADRAFCFSKALTQQALDITSDVPLIRVPHPLGAGRSDSKELAVPKLLDGFTTMFILSGLDDRMVTEEAESFDQSAMLFLNSVMQVDIDLLSVKRRLTRSVAMQPDGVRVERIENNVTDDAESWVITSLEGSDEAVAFAFDEGIITPAPPNKSVIHAFMPTTEFAGGLYKMNGDFSTDPSRKTVDLDSTSIGAFKRCVQVVAQLMQIAVSENRLPGIFSPFILATPIEGRFRKLFREYFLQEIEHSHWEIAGMHCKPMDIKLRPEWIGYSDYELLCYGKPHIPQKILPTHPHLPDFMRWLGVRSLSLDDALTLAKAVAPSPIGCAQIICRAAKQYRYDLTEECASRIANLPLLPTESGRRSPSDYNGAKLTKEFSEYLMQQQESEDIRYLSRRLKLPDGLLSSSVNNVRTGSIETLPSQCLPECGYDHVPKQSSSLFKTPPAIKSWRSAEQNALTWFAALSDVIAATDVSQANVGYDIEVVKRNGERLYVEVKSVPRFGDAFRLTNNEHATAYQLGSSYLLALVVNGSNQFHIRFVSDPVRRLKLEKRCEQWSWYGDDYLDVLIEQPETGDDSNSRRD